MMEHWAKYPPVHITAALFAGVKSERVASLPSANEPELTNADVVRGSRSDPRKVKWQTVANG